MNYVICIVRFNYFETRKSRTFILQFTSDDLAFRIATYKRDPRQNRRLNRDSMKVPSESPVSAECLRCKSPRLLRGPLRKDIAGITALWAGHLSSLTQQRR